MPNDSELDIDQVILDVCELPGDVDPSDPDALTLTVAELRIVLEREAERLREAAMTDSSPPLRLETLLKEDAAGVPIWELLRTCAEQFNAAGGGPLADRCSLMADELEAALTAVPLPNLYDRAAKILRRLTDGDCQPDDEYCWWCQNDVNGKSGEKQPHDPLCRWVEARSVIAKLEGEAQAVPSSSTPSTLTVVVNGQPVEVNSGPVPSVIQQAITKSGQIGAPIAQWELRTREGDVIPHDVDADWELTGGRLLFLNLGLPKLEAQAVPSPPPDPKATAALESFIDAGQKLREVVEGPSSPEKEKP